MQTQLTDCTLSPLIRQVGVAACRSRQHLYPSEKGRLSHGLAHLKGLREAGLNHIHLLPSYDYGSVPERPEEQAYVHVRVPARGGVASTAALLLSVVACSADLISSGSRRLLTLSLSCGLLRAASHCHS